MKSLLIYISMAFIFSPMVLSAVETKPVQISLINPVQIVDDVDSVSGIVNVAGEMVGLQFGLFNSARQLNGFQIGLININWSGEPITFLPIINFSF